MVRPADSVSSASAVGAKAAVHAVVGLVRQLAYELAPKVRVNGLGPDGMPTDLRGQRALGLAEVSFSGFPIDDVMVRLGPLERPLRPGRDDCGARCGAAWRRRAMSVC